MSTKKRSLDIYLAEVFKQYIALKDDDLKQSQEVFKSVFEQVKQKMGEKCNYFKKYSSQVMYAGSVYDGIKVSKLDEFDMDIVIRLPINYDDGPNGIIIENEQPGFVKMKIINSFDNLDKQKGWEDCHKVTREWRDSDKYFLQNKFRHWMHSIVQKALNDMNGKVTVNGVTYLVQYKESGPAYTLHIRNEATDGEFKLDVDLVPVIRFLHPRWPEGYRVMECTQIRDWLVVPKPIKSLNNDVMKNRCWRLSFQEFEREMMKGCQQLKTTIRLVKKLRDSLGMKAIASYYIKTIFLWKVYNNDKSYWQKKISEIFYEMVEEFHSAIKKKSIPYFWHDKNNLIENLKPSHQNIYADKLMGVLNSIRANDVEKVVSFLLTTDELTEFKKSEFYQKQALIISSTPTVSRQESKFDSSISESINLLNDELDALRPELPSNKLKELESRIGALEDCVKAQEDRLKRLEIVAFKNKVTTSCDNISDSWSLGDSGVGSQNCESDHSSQPLINF